MIIVKNKSVSTPIFINRDNVTSVENAEKKEFITRGEFDSDLTNYYTKEEVDELLANVGEDIPYFVVNSDWTGYEKGDFESVRQAIINGKPHFIYAPAPLGGYFSPNYVKVDFGQITCHFFYHTDKGANYYFFVYFHSDRINKSEKTIFYATTAELAEMGSYTLFIENDEQFGYQFYGKTTSSLKNYYNNNKNIAIKVKDNDVFYDANNISFTDDNGAIFFIDKIVDGELISVKFEVGYDDEIGENYIKKITETKIVGGSGESDVDLSDYYTKDETDSKYQPKGNYLTSIPSNYVTDDELEGKQATLVSGENIKTINGQSILGSGNISIEGGDANIVELTQAEYDVLDTKDEDTLYVITDATGVDVNLKTINGQSLIGEGNIVIEGGTGGGAANIVELTQAEYDALTNKDAETLYLITDVAVDLKTINGVSVIGGGDISVATEEWVLSQINDKLGVIETALSNLIGQ